MRTARIFLIGIVGLFAALLLQFWAKWATLVIAALPLGLLIAGQFYLVGSKRAIRLWLNPEVLEDTGEATLRLSGKVISVGFFKRWYEFEIQVSNVWLLLILGLASLAGIAGAWTASDLPLPGYNYWYFGSSVWVLVCYLAWRWLWERKAMRASGFALGSFHVAGMSGPLLKRVVYHFTDNKGEHWGGSLTTLFCDTQDDLTVVFHDERNPNISAPASAMMFHRLKWVDLQDDPDRRG